MDSHLTMVVGLFFYQIRTLLDKPTFPTRVLDTDIEKCLYTINHDWFLKPMENQILKSCLKAGYIESSALFLLPLFWVPPLAFGGARRLPPKESAGEVRRNFASKLCTCVLLLRRIKFWVQSQPSEQNRYKPSEKVNAPKNPKF